MTPEKGERRFSDQKHAQGGWRTRRARGTGPVRAFANFLSYKRKGVHDLAADGSREWLVLDCGCGNGAYTSWFLQRCPCTILSLDWSIQALRTLSHPKKGKVFRMCADIQMLPIKSQRCDALFTIDTLGHVRDQRKAFDEMLRVLKANAPVFLHSECGNYKLRWPDTMLRRKLGYDYLAGIDGHISLPFHAELHRMLLRRFNVVKFFSPAGLLGWIIGYPEKYYLAFREAHCRIMQSVTAASALIKRLPILGACMRFVNTLSNRLELFLGIDGGGSCFAVLRTPGENPDTIGAGASTGNSEVVP